MQSMEAEILRLSHLRDRASDLGRRKEYPYNFLRTLLSSCMQLDDCHLIFQFYGKFLTSAAGRLECRLPSFFNSYFLFILSYFLFLYYFTPYDWMEVLMIFHDKIIIYSMFYIFHIFFLKVFSFGPNNILIKVYLILDLS